MRTSNESFILNKNADTNSPIYLYTLHDYDGNGHNLYYAEYDIVVTFGGVSYNPFPIMHDFVPEGYKGEVDRVKVTVSNISRAIAGYLSIYDFRGKKVTIKTVWANSLTSSEAYVDDIYYIDTYTMDEEKVEFSLTSKMDVLNVVLPKRNFLRNYCSWKFKSTECGYTGTGTSCNKTITNCRSLGNQLRFGGFPSIPSQRTYLG